ncbi:hypothetical protein LINGRAHAP2_LOCUS31824 [Linum grandiflorum]
MTKAKKVPGMTDSRHERATPHPLSLIRKNKAKHGTSKKNRFQDAAKKDWEGATCSVCLEYPHNAVLLLCSSYSKGCHPYMCATGRQFSNCLEQYKKAYSKAISIEGIQEQERSGDHLDFILDRMQLKEKVQVPELLCPLCRGQVKGWTVVEAARKYLNRKKRSCMLDNCSFVGSYRQLKKHVKAKHPLGCSRAVDPVLEKKWKTLEFERERNDVISTVLSSAPGAMVLGDYVIEPGAAGIYGDEDELGDDDDGFYPLHHYQDVDYGSFDGYRMRHAASASSAALPGSSLHRMLFGRPRRSSRYGRGNRSAFRR